MRTRSRRQSSKPWLSAAAGAGGRRRTRRSRGLSWAGGTGEGDYDLAPGGTAITGGGGQTGGRDGVDLSLNAYQPASCLCAWNSGIRASALATRGNRWAELKRCPTGRQSAPALARLLAPCGHRIACCVLRAACPRPGLEAHRAGQVGAGWCPGNGWGPLQRRSKEPLGLAPASLGKHGRREAAGGTGYGPCGSGRDPWAAPRRGGHGRRARERPALR